MSLPVVFVPGFMQRGEAWRAVAELLPERYPSVLLDHERHDLHGRLEEIATAGRDAVLCGYSLGGRLALLAATRDPSAYRAVVALGAGAGFDDAGERAERRQRDEQIATWMERSDIEDVVAVWERQPLFADQSDVLVQAQRPGRLSHDPRELASLMRTAGQGAIEPFWHELEQLELPLLALAGQRDERYTTLAWRIAERVPHAEVRVIEDAGHAPQLQRPERVAELVVEFLDEHFGQRVG